VRNQQLYARHHAAHYMMHASTRVRAERDGCHVNFKAKEVHDGLHLICVSLYHFLKHTLLANERRVTGDLPGVHHMRAVNAAQTEPSN